MFTEASSRITAALVVAALSCGLWALWPAVFPTPRVPTVTREVMPTVQPAAQQVAAPVYKTTASITPLVSGPLNLNTATEEQLESLPKVGPSLAGRILAGRPYRSLQDLDAVKGVGPSLMKTLTPLVTF